MLNITRNIKFLYTINLVEGEGVGTAYEYFTKLRKLQKFINSIEKPRKILIAGLPEKYGLSMDFFLMGHILNADIVAVDERTEVLERAQKVFSSLKSKQRFDDKKVVFQKVEKITKLDNERLIEGNFDLALSSEVYQRLDGDQKIFLSNLNKLTKNFALFVPNSGNSAHAKLSGLNSINLKELLTDCENYAKVSIHDCGYLDMPPFPPGLNRSKEKRIQAAGSQLDLILMKGLQFYGICEDLLPRFLKEKIAHIVYVMAHIQKFT